MAPDQFASKGIPLTIYRPVSTIATHETSIQMGNEQADAHCTVIRLSRPNEFNLSTEDGWQMVKRLLEWVRVKCRHYWLLHGIIGFGATYRGSLFTRNGRKVSQQNLSMYGPNVIVKPLTLELWMTLAVELESGAELPIADSLYCDSLLSIVAGDSVKALLEAGVAIEIAVTKLLVDMSASLPETPAKKRFVRQNGDRAPFGKKLTEWTRDLGLNSIETFSFQGIPPSWIATVMDLYKLRNGVAHAGKATGTAYHNVVEKMFAAGALLEYCRAQRIQFGLGTYTMPAATIPAQQILFCHDASISTSSSTVRGLLPP